MISDFIKERNEVFASMDKAKILEYCNKYNISVPTDEKIFWMGVHKTICNLYVGSDDHNSITLEQYNKSYEWLTQHGTTPDID